MTYRVVVNIHVKAVIFDSVESKLAIDEDAEMVVHRLQSKLMLNLPFAGVSFVHLRFALMVYGGHR